MFNEQIGIVSFHVNWIRCNPFNLINFHLIPFTCIYRWEEWRAVHLAKVSLSRL